MLLCYSQEYQNAKKPTNLTNNSKGTQQSSRKIILRDAAYDAMRKITVIPIQYMKRERMTILNKNKVRLVNDETSSSNPDYSSVIYPTAAKVAQYRLVDENRREREDAKKETAKKTFT